MTRERLCRRAVLRRVGALGLSTGVAGCQFRKERSRPATDVPGRAPDSRSPDVRSPDSRSPTRSETPVPASIERRYGERFDEIVHIVEAGAAPDGTSLIDTVIERVLDDDTLVYFPPGIYRVGSVVVRNVENAGIVAAPAGKTRIVPTIPAVDIDHLLFRFLSVSEFLFEGFTLDYRAAGVGGATQVISQGPFTVRDLLVRGTMPDETLPSNPATFRFDVRDESATGVVERLALPDGGHDGGNAVGLYVGKDHAGTLRFVDCEVANFPNNGLYASAPGRTDPDFTGRNGTVHVRGGRYENNNIANVRLGSTDSTARGVSILVDRVPPSHAGALNARGLRVRNRGGQAIEDCDITLGEHAGNGFGGLVFHPNAGHTTIRNTTIRVDRDDVHAITALDDEQFPSNRGPTLENVTVTGSADGGWAVDIAGRDDVTFENCSIRQTGSARNGLSFVDCGRCTIDGGEIAVPGVPVESRRSTIITRNLTRRGREVLYDEV